MRSIKYDPKAETNAASAIAQLLTVPSDRPISIVDARLGVRVLDKIDAAKGELLLEDAEFAFVRVRIETAQFAFVNRELVACLDAVLAAPEAQSE